MEGTQPLAAGRDEKVRRDRQRVGNNIALTGICVRVCICVLLRCFSLDLPGAKPLRSHICGTARWLKQCTQHEHCAGCMCLSVFCACWLFSVCPAQRQQMPPEQCTSIEAKASARFSWPHIVECVIWLETQLWMKRRRVSLNLQSQTQNPEPQTIHAFIEPKLLSTGSRPHARKP